MSIDAALSAFEEQLDPLARVVRLFSASLDPPVLVDDREGRVYRYRAPDIRHFCLLKAVVTLSALNASLVLARHGYIFQVFVLLRTVFECASQIEYVLDPSEDDDHRVDVERYVSGYFADSDRDPAAATETAAQVRQKKVHTVIGKTLDHVMEQSGETEGRKPGADAYFAVYRAFSNFVHGKYPESIDLYGGRPGWFHMTGMSGTPKDDEMLAMLEPVIGTASNVFAQMIQRLGLGRLVGSDPVIASWYRGRVGQPPSN
ncbi:MAG: hypothetical protein ACLPTZ_00390 [Beijerinckiaceae bacterium]